MASTVIRWLNNGPWKVWEMMGRNTRPSRQRIIDLIETIADTQQAIKEHPNQGERPAGFSNWHLAAIAPNRKLKVLMHELFQRINQYPTHATCSVTIDGELVLDTDALNERPYPIGESLAGHAVVRLQGLGLLGRIRQCHCGNWFYAKFEHQHFCSATCRRRHHQSSAEYKADRRKYMRNYYRLKNSGKVK